MSDLVCVDNLHDFHCLDVPCSSETLDSGRIDVQLVSLVYEVDDREARTEGVGLGSTVVVESQNGACGMASRSK